MALCVDAQASSRRAIYVVALARGALGAPQTLQGSIKATTLERIFEKFYRSGRIDGRKAGTGLGLSISRGLVKAMGGTIVAQSPAVRRRGTRIIMRFPAVRETKRGVAA